MTATRPAALRAGTSRPPSPPPRENHSVTLQGTMDELPLPQSRQSGASSHDSSLPQNASSNSLDLAMGLPKSYHHSSLDIVLPGDKFYIKPHGSAAEPSILSGNVILILSEPTSIKEITLNLKGKAKLPALTGDASSTHLLQANYHSVVVYNHEWTFLAGEKRTSHTLKAGRHVFPFQVELTESVPSSLMTHDTSLGISYKLRAVVVRSAFSNNFHAQLPVTILRSLPPDALEYQQTLEIENTWPEKIMYSLLIPHKAWAAGDTICALVKFSPLSKGVWIQSVLTTVNESTKVQYKFGPIEHSRIVASIKHEFIDGKPHVIDTYAVKPSAKSQGGMFHIAGSGSSTPFVPGAYSIPGSTGSSSGTTTPMTEQLSFPLGSLSRANSRLESLTDSSNSMYGARFAGSSAAQNQPEPVEPTRDELTTGEQDIIALLPVTLPATAAPSHSVDPIDVHYRIRWVVLVMNPDGHSSELRCSLPIMVLDHSLLTESRLATNETRRLCFGLANSTSTIDDIELPSYSNHVLDRVANSFFPSNSTRITNIWAVHGMDSPLFYQEPRAFPNATRHAPGPSSTPSTPEIEPRQLDWVSNELMHSLGDSWRSSHPRRNTADSEPPSRRGSRPSSRSSSPERTYSTYTHPATQSSTNTTSNTSQPHSSRHHGLFNLSLKPFTSLSSRNTPRHTPPVTPPSLPVQPVPLSATRSETPQTVLMSAFTEVPDYDIASRGFLGGGIPPLESVRGLPSYEEAERSTSSQSSSHSTPSHSI